jgi:LAO/AO transport system kinase
LSAELHSALKYLPARSPAWRAPALAVSGLTGDGLDELWRLIERHRSTLEAAGELVARRREQQRRWMWSMIEERLVGSFRADPRVAALLPALEAAVLAGTLTPSQAATQLLAATGAPGALD